MERALLHVTQDAPAPVDDRAQLGEVVVGLRLVRRQEALFDAQLDEQRLGVGEEVVFRVLGDAHLAVGRVGKRDADRVEAVLRLDAQRQHDGVRHDVRVEEQQIFHVLQVARRRLLADLPRAAAAPGALVRRPDLDAELLRGECVAQEALGRRHGQRAGRQPAVVALLPEVLEH